MKLKIFERIWLELRFCFRFLRHPSQFKQIRKERIICLYLRTVEGRKRLAAAMLNPLRGMNRRNFLTSTLLATAAFATGTALANAQPDPKRFRKYAKPINFGGDPLAPRPRQKDAQLVVVYTSELSLQELANRVRTVPGLEDTVSFSILEGDNPNYTPQRIRSETTRLGILHVVRAGDPDKTPIEWLRVADQAYTYSQAQGWVEIKKRYG